LFVAHFGCLRESYPDRPLECFESAHWQDRFLDEGMEDGEVSSNHCVDERGAASKDSDIQYRLFDWDALELALVQPESSQQFGGEDTCALAAFELDVAGGAHALRCNAVPGASVGSLRGGAPKIDATSLFDQIVLFEKKGGRMPSRSAVANVTKELQTVGVIKNSPDWTSAIAMNKAETSLYWKMTNNWAKFSRAQQSTLSALRET